MFIILIIGLGTSLFIAIIECIAYKIRDKNKEGTTVDIIGSNLLTLTDHSNQT